MRRLFYGIQKKIILAATLIIGVLFLATYVGIYQIVKSDIYDLLSEKYAYINEKMQDAFEVTQENLDQLTANFILNDYVQKSLTNQHFGASDLEMMKKGLAYQNRSFLDYYLIIDNKGNMYGQREVELNFEAFLQSELYQSLEGAYSKTNLLWTEDILFGTGEMSFFAVRYIHEMNSAHEPGVLVLKLNDHFLDDLRESIQDDQLYYFMLDAGEKLCFYQFPKAKETDDPAFFLQTILNNNRNEDLSDGIVNKRYDSESGFTLITYAPAEVSNTLVFDIQITMAGIFLVAYIITLAAISVFTRKLMAPVKILSDKMVHFDESRLDERVELNTNTELDDMGRAYNNMVAKVKALMGDVQKKERELRESEMHTLIYQIRPHFLYNTLDNIYMLARIQKEETIMKMIQALSRFLRINLSNGKEEISVEKELEHVESYLEIQKIRNSELFTYEITCEPEIVSLHVMKMLLQPIAENCIKYGFQNIYEGGRIWIRAYTEENQLCFSVENNGEPIAVQAMEKLNRLESISMEEMDMLIEERNGGFGIINVVKRLRMKYESGIRFYYLRKEEGTECIIKINLEEKKDETTK